MYTIKFSILILFLLVAYQSYAGTPPPTPVPFDPISALVLGAGGTLVARKILKSKEK